MPSGPIPELRAVGLHLGFTITTFTITHSNTIAVAMQKNRYFCQKIVIASTLRICA